MTQVDPRAHTVMHVDALADDTLVTAQVDGTEVVLLKRGNSVAAFEGRCPHRGTLLAEGTVEGETIVCAGHGWRFDARTGANADPSRPCLRQFATEVVDGHVLIDAPALDRTEVPPAPGVTPVPRAQRSPDDLPGPRGLPLVGNVLQMNPKRLHEVLERWQQEHGDTYRIDLAGTVMVVTSAPALAREVLRRRPDDFRRFGTVEPVFSEIGALGVFAAEGDDWRLHRRLVTRALDARHVRNFMPMLEQITRRLHRRWSAAADAGAVLDMPHELMRYTVDVTTSLVFGYDSNTIEDGDDVIQRHLQLVFPMVNRRVNAPVAYWRKIRLPSDRRLDAALAEVHAYCQKLIGQTRQRVAADPGIAAHPSNLLEAMVAATTENGERFTENELLGNMLTMLLAGEDTTANTLAWMVSLVCQSSGVRDALRHEIDGVAADQPRTYIEHNQLPYTDAVVAEAMRLKPVAPVIFFQANHDVVLGDLSLPRGTGVILLTRLPGVDPSVVEAPEEFQPDRWLASPTSPVGWRADVLPFGGGPRFCPGRNLALIEARMVTTMLYRHFDVQLVSDPADVRERFSFTMAPTELRVRLHPR